MIKDILNFNLSYIDKKFCYPFLVTISSKVKSTSASSGLVERNLSDDFLVKISWKKEDSLARHNDRRIEAYKIIKNVFDFILIEIDVN